MFDAKLIIPDDVYQKIMWWINKSHHEVSGFGSLDFDPATGIFTVRDAILLKQEVAPTSTEIDPAALGKAMYEMRGEVNALKWHWHSHVNMGVFWSGDDRTLIKNLGSQGWIVATVFNKKRELKSAFYTMVDIGVMGIIKKQELFLEDIPSTIQRYIPDALCEAWDKSYDEHVTVASARSLTPVGSGAATYWKKKTGFVDKTNRNPVTKGDKKYYDHDEFGYRWSHKYDRWVYNPVYDQQLKTDEEIIDALLTMDDEEIECADWYTGDPMNRKFDSLYPKAIEKLDKDTTPKGKTKAEIAQENLLIERYYENFYHD